MSTNPQPNVNLGGMNVKDWALIILLASLAIVFVAWSLAFATAIINSPTTILEGNIDVGQLTGILIGIAMVAVVFVGQKLTSQQQTEAVARTDNVWLAEAGITVNPPNTPGKTTGFSMPELLSKTLMMGAYIRKVYDSDAQLTPAEQQEAIKMMDGLTAAEMEALIPITGPELADSIRKLISKHRATNRTNKDTV